MFKFNKGKKHQKFISGHYHHQCLGHQCKIPSLRLLTKPFHIPKNSQHGRGGKDPGTFREGTPGFPNFYEIALILGNYVANFS